MYLNINALRAVLDLAKMSSIVLTSEEDRSTSTSAIQEVETFINEVEEGDERGVRYFMFTSQEQDLILAALTVMSGDMAKGVISGDLSTRATCSNRLTDIIRILWVLNNTDL